MPPKTDVTRAILSRDFVARVRDFIARQSRRRCLRLSSCRAATLSRKQTPLLRHFSRFTNLLHKHSSKMTKLFHTRSFLNSSTDRTAFVPQDNLLKLNYYQEYRNQSRWFGFVEATKSRRCAGAATTGVNPAGDVGDTSPQYFGWGDVNGNIPPILLRTFGYSRPILVVLRSLSLKPISFGYKTPPVRFSQAGGQSAHKARPPQP